MATVDVLVAGYARRDGEVARVAGTVSLVRATRRPLLRF